jgi:beta-glucosidase
MTTYRFPEGFLWGAATSAYQIEGSPLADGAGMSVQHRFAHTPGNTLDGANGDVLADSYHRWPEDIAIMQEIGLPAYQFSIAWPRLLPEGTGHINQPGFDYYDRLVDAMLEANIAPCPILHVWDLPGALQDRGGWANRDSADWFAEYAQIVYDLIGDRAVQWMTICEPASIVFGGYVGAILPPGVKDIYAGLAAGHNLLRAHGKAVQAFRASGAAGTIGTSFTAKPAEEDSLLYLDPVMTGHYPEGIVESYGEQWPEMRDGDLEEISTPIDFLGVTYYSNLWLATEEGPSYDGATTDIGWPIQPEGTYENLVGLSERYGHPPMYVTENGAAFNDTVVDGAVHDERRIAYIRDHLIHAHRAIADGVDLRGWCVWSLLDTYEFWLGTSARFGLVHIDWETSDRTIRDSAYWYRDVIKNNGFDV